MNVFLETYFIMLKEFYYVTVTEVNIFQWRYVHSWKLKSEESLRANKIKSILSDVIVPNEPTNVYFRHSSLADWSSFLLFICRLLLLKKILYFQLIFRYLKWHVHMLCTWLLRNFYQESVNHSWVLTRRGDGSGESWLQAPVQETSKIITFNQTSRSVITVLFFTHTFRLTSHAIVRMATFFTTIWSLKARGTIWKKNRTYFQMQQFYVCLYSVFTFLFTSFNFNLSVCLGCTIQSKWWLIT